MYLLFKFKNNHKIAYFRNEWQNENHKRIIDHKQHQHDNDHFIRSKHVEQKRVFHQKQHHNIL